MTLRIVGAGLVPNLHEHFLQDIGRLLLVVEDAEDGGVEDAGVTVVKQREGLPVALGHAVQELRVVHGGGGVHDVGAVWRGPTSTD